MAFNKPNKPTNQLNKSWSVLVKGEKEGREVPISSYSIEHDETRTLKDQFFFTNIEQFQVPVAEYEPPELFRKSEFTDIILIVEGKELHFAKHPLMAGSIVFANMFKDSKDKSRLVLDDVPYDDMIMFLECLHPKTLQVTTDTNLEQVSSIAHRFKHEGILHRCEEYIVERFNLEYKSKDGMYPEFFFHLRVADKCGLKRAVQAGLMSERVKKAYFSSKNLGKHELHNTFKGYENDDNFRHLSSNTKFEILRRRLTVMEKVFSTSDPFLPDYL